MATVIRAGSSVQKSAGFHACTVFRLPACRVQMLPEISLPVQQRKRHQRNAKVCRRPQRIPRQDPQAA